MLRVVQAYLKHCCSLCEAVVEMKVCSKVHCIAPPTNLHALIECCMGITQAAFFSFVMLLCA